MYYAIPGRARGWRSLYRKFVAPGDLCFDIGAHMGNRTGALLAVGARVLAVEPQPLFASVLKRLYGRDPNFILQACAIGLNPGSSQMLISSRTPTVSTLSADWAAQVHRTPSFSTVNWDERVEVQVKTLDGLIAEFGLPTFCKLDIEGFELEALQRLSRPIGVLSFEFLPAALDRAFLGVERLARLGNYRFNYIKGEYPRLALENWVPAEELNVQLRALPDDGRAGEVYAQLH